MDKHTVTLLLFVSQRVSTGRVVAFTYSASEPVVDRRTISFGTVVHECISSEIGAASSNQIDSTARVGKVVHERRVGDVDGTKIFDCPTRKTNVPVKLRIGHGTLGVFFNIYSSTIGSLVQFKGGSVNFQSRIGSVDCNGSTLEKRMIRFCQMQPDIAKMKHTHRTNTEAELTAASAKLLRKTD